MRRRDDASKLRHPNPPYLSYTHIAIATLLVFCDSEDDGPMILPVPYRGHTLLETTGPKRIVHPIRRPEFMHPCPSGLNEKFQSLYPRSDCSYSYFVSTGTVHLRIIENSALPHFSASSITVTFSSELYNSTMCYYAKQEPICIA